MALKKSTVRLIFLSLFYLFFLLVGTAVFLAIEGPIEEKRLHKLLEVRSQFLQNRQHCLSGDDLDDFVDIIIEADKAGISVSHNISSDPNWSFGQSFFFVTSLLTTVGYGHVSPLSDGGKIFCVVYAVFGIPLTLILFTALVERLMIIASFMYDALLAGFGQSFRVLYVRLTHVFIVFCFVLVVLFLIPSAIFTIIETNWNFLDAFYYCFISVTTIGLGDYIPGDELQQSNRPLYKICAALYLFFGIVLMLLLLTNVYNVPELNFGRYFSLHSVDVGDDVGEHQRLQPPLDGNKPPRYTTTDTAVSSTMAEQDSGTGGGGGTKKSEKAEDKKKLTDDSL